MTDRELINQLNSLQKLAPEASWLKSNRELLLTQISNSGAEKLSVWKTFTINLVSLAKTSVQPAYALGAFVLVLVCGTLFSSQLLAAIKPNDSLYIARVISEKAKLATVFNSEERDKLAAKFAAQRAQDITAVLADPKFNNEQNQTQIAELTSSFNQEITTVKNQVSHLSAVNPVTPTATDSVVAIADNSKDNQGLQVAANPLINYKDTGAKKVATDSELCSFTFSCRNCYNFLHFFTYNP